MIFPLLSKQSRYLLSILQEVNIEKSLNMVVKHYQLFTQTHGINSGRENETLQIERCYETTLWSLSTAINQPFQMAEYEWLLQTVFHTPDHRTAQAPAARFYNSLTGQTNEHHDNTGHGLTVKQPFIRIFLTAVSSSGSEGGAWTFPLFAFRTMGFSDKQTTQGSI